MTKKIEIEWKDETYRFVVDGDYKLLKLTENEAYCLFEEFELAVIGEEVTIQAMLGQQLIATIQSLTALQVKRL